MDAPATPFHLRYTNGSSTILLIIPAAKTNPRAVGTETAGEAERSRASPVQPSPRGMAPLPECRSRPGGETDRRP